MTQRIGRRACDQGVAGRGAEAHNNSGKIFTFLCLCLQAV